MFIGTALFIVLIVVVVFGAFVLLAFKELEKIMSDLSDKIAAVGASLDAAVLRVQEDVTNLTDKIAELQNLVDQGSAFPADHDALEALKAKLDAIDPVKPVVLPE